MENRLIKFRAWYPEEKKLIEVSNLLGEKSIAYMQFTGLLDKNGVEIYENDILDIDDYGMAQVVFSEGMYKYVPVKETKTTQKVDGVLKFTDGEIFVEEFYPTINSPLEVIGDIYQNPELLN